MADLKVEQRHRDAAAGIYQNFRDHDFAAWVRNGTNAGRDANFVIQAFARFERDHMNELHGNSEQSPTLPPGDGSANHPWYGGCDALAPGHLCAECLKLAPALPPGDVEAKATVTVIEAFEMGYGLAYDVSRPQSREDSRAVGRLLGSNLFEPIAAQIAAAEKALGFDPFTDADSGIVQAKAIITAALASATPSDQAVSTMAVVAQSPTNEGNIVYRGEEWVPLSAYQEAMAGWKAANAARDMAVVDGGLWEAIIELERYADKKTAVAFSVMMLAKQDGDTDFEGVMKRERDAYSDITMRLRSILATSQPDQPVLQDTVSEMAAALRNTPAEALREAGYLDRAANMLESMEPRGCPIPGACACPAPRAALANPPVLDQGDARRDALRRMVALDEEAEAKHPGWMTGTPDESTGIIGGVDLAEIRAEIVNTPETADFMAGVPLEAAHQRERWGVDHDAGKTPYDWFWLIGYLSQKAADAAVRGDIEKAKHHTISTAAALANWHAALTGADTRMRPGIAPPNVSSPGEPDHA